MRLHKIFTNNFIVLVLILLLVVFLSIAFYIYDSFTLLEDQNSTHNFVKTNNLEFADLPSYIQDEYILKYECPKTTCPKVEPIIKTVIKTQTKTIHKIDNKKIKELQKDIENLKIKLSKQKVKIVQKVVEKIIKVPQKNIVVKKRTNSKNKDFFKNEKFIVSKCYDMQIGKSDVSKKCKKNIFKLLNNTKNIKYLVVIGVVDKLDLKLLNKYKSKEVRNILQSGLAFKRVENTIWTIRDKMKKRFKIFPSNYKVVSKYKNRGVVVRAYY